jgi:prevent-host-death family protein
MKATAKDLRYNLKNILESVSRGEEVLITNRGRIKARIISAEKKSDKQEPNDFVGMWKDRDDMQSVNDYVRDLRKGRFA